MKSLGPDFSKHLLVKLPTSLDLTCHSVVITIFGVAP